MEMTAKVRIAALAALAAAFFGWGPGAWAAKASYTTTGHVSGYYTYGGTTTNFTDVLISLTAYGDTDDMFTSPSVPGATFLPFSKASLTSPLGVFPIDLGPDNRLIMFADNPGKGGFVDFATYHPATKVFESNLIDGAPALLGYRGFTSIGPVPVGSSWTDETDLKNGVDVFFTRSGDFTFTASVPEPGIWAMLLTGFMAAGAALRARRKAPATL
jgi:hypothetical protein